MRSFQYKKAVQALNYFALLNNGMQNKMKAIKLVWLADRLHMRRYGRTITGDEYFALPNGPVPSGTRDILENNSFLPDPASEYATKFIESYDRYNYKSLSMTITNVFSKTDIDCLDAIYSKYGHLGEFELSDLSHKFPEWKKFEFALLKKISSRFEIDKHDFFINLDDNTNLFIDTPENIELSIQIYEMEREVSQIFS